MDEIALACVCMCGERERERERERGEGERLLSVLNDKVYIHTTITRRRKLPLLYVHACITRK